MVKNKFKIITIALFVACMIGFSSVAKADTRWVTFCISNAKLPVREMLLYLQTFLLSLHLVKIPHWNCLELPETLGFMKLRGSLLLVL